MKEPLRVFVGWDDREAAAYHVLSHSIIKRSSGLVSITPIVQPALRDAGIYARQRQANESTAFSLTRFLVPYLSGFEGISIFLDVDMLCLADISDVVPDDWCPKAVWCVKHDYTPKSETKFLDQPNRVYRCKNWSSLMVFNNAECRALTPEYVNSAHGLELHQFFWLGKDGEERIGSLPPEWNHLVGEYPPNAEAKLLHYTLGGPWFDGYSNCDHADLWFAERALALGAKPPARVG